MKTVAIYANGPESDIDCEGEEIPCWTVYAGDEEAEPTSKVYTFHNLAGALALANKMAADRRVELVNETMPA